jgi:uncharacterized protein with ParB-like and HNH nuclease domain
MREAVKFEARDTKIRDVLFADYAYKIPRYQRPYTWDDDQVSEFWNDLMSDEGSSFLGSLIFNNENFEETRSIDIIDGQQRLLTITIFVAVLRDIAKEIDKSKGELYQRKDLAFEDRITGKQTYRITPGDQTREYFEKNVQDLNANIMESTPSNEEQKKIKKNYMFFYEKVTDELKKYINKDDQLNYLNNLRDRIGNLSVISIQIVNEDEAYEIFETTNARGVDLSVADLLKNFIFKKLPPSEDKDSARDRWQMIIDLVEETSTEMRRFIRQYWISKHASVTEKRLFREIKKETVDYSGLLDDLWLSADIYKRILEGNERDWAGFKNGRRMFGSTSALRIMNVSQCNVLFLAILRNFDKIATDPSRIFELIEKFSFKYHIVCKLPSNKVEKVYGRYAKSIEDTVKGVDEKHIPRRIQSAFSALEIELKEISPHKDFFISEFKEISYKNTEQSRKLIKYILGKIDNSYRLTKEELIDFDNVNIEHLLPQKPGKDWGLMGKEIKQYVNRLGNLTIVDKTINSIAGNKKMQEKVDILTTSRLPINKRLVEEITANNYKWDEGCINKRQEQLAEMAWEVVWEF